MDLSLVWLTEVEMEDPNFANQYEQMNEELPYDDTVYNLSVDSFSSESNPDNTDRFFQIPIKHQPSYRKTGNQTAAQSPAYPLSTTTTTLPSNAFTISFGDLKPKDDILPFDDSFGYAKKVQPTMVRNPTQAQDHVLAERKRRHKLNQHFITLSSLLPNLKKMDRASVLEDASNYIKELEGRKKELEGSLGNGVQESIISIKRSRLNGTDHNESSSFDDTNFEESNSSPTIEVRMSGNNMLVKILCQKKKSSSLVKALRMMNNLGLSVISSSSMPFANTILLITIVAQIEEDFCMSVTDLVKNLQLAV